MKAMKKQQVLIVAGPYRIVYRSGYGVVEKRRERDALGALSWRAVSILEVQKEWFNFVDAIAKALIRRRKRRKANK